MGAIKSSLAIGVIIGLCALADTMYLTSTPDFNRAPALNKAACDYMIDQLGYCKGAGR